MKFKRGEKGQMYFNETEIVSFIFKFYYKKVKVQYFHALRFLS